MHPDPSIEILQTAQIEIPQLSVIVPAHNAGPYLLSCIHSILNQPDIALEIIIINDGSTDHTLEQMKLFLDNPRITLLNAPQKLGASTARNQAVLHARAEWLCPFDADDVMFNNSLAPYFHFVTSRPNAFWGYCGQRFANAELKPTGTDMCSHFDFVLMIGSNMVCHGMSLFRKERFLAAGRYDPSIRIGQDYDLFLRFLQHGDPIFYNHVCYFYRRHTANSNNIGHTKKITHEQRMHDSVHTALLDRLRTSQSFGNQQRITNIATALTLLNAAIASDWETVLECSRYLSQNGVSSLWKDHLAAQALTVTGRHADAFSIMAPWLRTFNQQCDWRPHEIVLILQRNLELAQRAQLAQQEILIEQLIRQIINAATGSLLARQLQQLLSQST